MDIRDTEEVEKRRKRQKRRQKLLSILQSIVTGTFNAGKPPIQFRFDQKKEPSQRAEYIGPLDRGSFNYGYMTVPEMQSGSDNY